MFIAVNTRRRTAGLALACVTFSCSLLSTFQLDVLSKPIPKLHYNTTHWANSKIALALPLVAVLSISVLRNFLDNKIAAKTKKEIFHNLRKNLFAPRLHACSLKSLATFRGNKKRKVMSWLFYTIPAILMIPIICGTCKNISARLDARKIKYQLDQEQTDCLESAEQVHMQLTEINLTLNEKLEEEKAFRAYAENKLQRLRNWLDRKAHVALEAYDDDSDEDDSF
ncbi:hypothetical protein HOD08_01520 [bacterium]|jgi:hypothetical protein|nr:hypothetical protein [bacterium]